MNVQVRFKTRVIAEAATSLRCKTDTGAVYSNFCSYLWPEDISLASLHDELCKLFGQSPDGDERVGFCNRGALHHVLLDATAAAHHREEGRLQPARRWRLLSCSLGSPFRDNRVAECV